MTDQIELPPVPQTPPLVRLDGYVVDDGPAVIRFNGRLNKELIVPLEIRNEDRNETLKMRWKVEDVTRPFPPDTTAYPCPGEPEIPGDGNLLKRKATLIVQGTSLPVGTCNRVDVIVSGSFKTCRPESDDPWDSTTEDEDDAVIGRLSFTVWSYDEATDPLVQPSVAVPLLTSCEQLEYQPPSATATSTSAATPGL